MFTVSHRRSLFSRWSRKAHLPSIPLNANEHNILSSASPCEQQKSTRMKRVIHLLSCQARLPHRSDETHQALKRSQRQVGCMDKCTERVRRPERWRMRLSHSFSHGPDISCDSGLSLQEHRSPILPSVCINKTNSNQIPYCCYFIIIKKISESLRTLSPSGPIFPGNPFLPTLP